MANQCETICTFDPASAIVRGALDLCSAVSDYLPAFSRMADSSFSTRDSRVSSAVWPACKTVRFKFGDENVPKIVSS